MPSEKSCKSCKYSKFLGETVNVWCTLRKIKVHSEISSYFFCHHWSQKEPLLPVLDQRKASIHQQLDFARELAANESYFLVFV